MARECVEVSPIGFKQVRTSDLTGADLQDDQVVTVVVRNHPDAEEAKVFDAAAEELKDLKGVNDLVELELRRANGSTSTLVVSIGDFNKLVPKDRLARFDSARGRRTGFRPSGS